MSDRARAARLAKRILTIVAVSIEHELKDDRLRFVTITDAKVTGDLHDAELFYTVRGKTPDAKPDTGLAADALKSATPRLRKIVGEQLSVRFTPTLKFTLDTVPQTSSQFEEILQRAKIRDESTRRQRENARPAGDANPYKEK